MKKTLQTVNINDITPYENNPRRNDDAVEAVAESIKQCEYIAPIIVDENMVILAGHTRHKALKELGHDHVEVMIVEGLTEEQKKKYRLLDNKTNELAEWDFDKLTLELDNIDFGDFDFGFDFNTNTNSSEIVDYTPKSLSDDFIIPPFDVFDARQGYWVDRKKIWKEKINDVGQARLGAKAYHNEMFEEDRYNFGSLPNGTSVLDPVLSEVVLRWFTPKTNSKCFDCFAGDTVFGYVAGSLGHTFTGIELRQEQVDFNNEHTKDFDCIYICDDGQNVAEHIKDEQDLLFSCPPYYDLEVYSDDPKDASNQDTYEDFYKILDTAFTNSISCLADNRFAVIVVGDVRDKRGAYYNFPNDVINTFVRNGCVLYSNIKLLTPIGTAQVRARNSMRNRKPAHVYQDVLVFYKGDTNKIKTIFPEIKVKTDDSENE